MILESKINQALFELDCPMDTLAILSGISKSTLSRGFRHLRDFTGPEAETLLKTVEGMRQLREDFQPFPLSFQTKHAAIIRELLQARQTGVRWHVRVDTK